MSTSNSLQQTAAQGYRQWAVPAAGRPWCYNEPLEGENVCLSPEIVSAWPRLCNAAAKPAGPTAKVPAVVLQRGHYLTALRSAMRGEGQP